MYKSLISLLVIVSLFSVGYADSIAFASKQKSKTGKKTKTSQIYKKSAPDSKPQTQDNQQKIAYLKQQSTTITANCQDENLKEACAIFQEILRILDQIQTSDAKSIINQLNSAYSQRVELFQQRFYKANQTILRTLKKYRDFIENNIGPNQGTDVLNRDVQELTALLQAYTNDYANSYKKITAVINKQSIPSSQASAVYTAVIAYDEDLLNIIKNYPKYSLHIDISVHYLRALNNSKIFSNHKVYGEDVYDMAILGETYYEAYTQNLKDLLKGSNGLVPQISKILPKISNLATQWFSLFTVQNQSQLSSQYASVRQNQNQIDVGIIKIYKKELEVAREVCELRNSDEPALCTYSYGAIFYAILDPNETVTEALCAETPDPAKCEENAELIRHALVTTLKSFDPSIESFFYNLMQEFLSDEQYDQVIEFIEALNNALSDGEISEEELAVLKEMILNYDYSEERIDQFLAAICKNAEDVEECSEDIKSVVDMIKQYKAGELTIEEFIQEMFPDIDDLNYENLPNAQEELEELHETIGNSIILLDGSIRFLENRSLSGYTDNLKQDLTYLQTKYENLLEIYYQILINLDQLEETINPQEIARIITETTRLITEYTRLLIELQQFYLNTYYPHVYSGVFRTINYTYDRNISRTELMIKNLEDMIVIYRDLYPYVNWNSITTQINDIKPILTEANIRIPNTNEALHTVLLSSEPKPVFSANEVLSKQSAVNQIMRRLIIEKAELFISIYTAFDAVIIREEEK